MNRRVPRTALESQCKIDEFFYFGIFHRRLHLRYGLKGLRNAYISPAYRRRDHLGDLFDIAVEHIQGPADIFDRRPRSHCSKSNDLANGFATVEFGPMVDPVPPS